MIQAITRFVLVAAGLLGGYAVAQAVDWQAQIPGLPQNYVIFLFIILGGSIGFVLGGIIGRELSSAWVRVEAKISEVAAAELILATIGLVVGLVVAFFAAQPLRMLQPPGLAAAVMILLSIVCSYLAISVALTRRREFAAIFPRLSSAELVTAEERLMVLDTSAVIDGRFHEMQQIGFMPGRVRVPRFVLAELQTLADSADEGKRMRGRRGLDLLAALPEKDVVDVFELDYPDTPAVDEKLMRLATDTGGVMVTVDFNLSKVARLRGIEVLNLNEAAAALRPNFLPGDAIRLRVAKSGKEPGQGVGYLEDGTMVVVQEGRDLVGGDADVEVTSVLQTSAGRMIFARPSRGSAEEAHE
jgi:uncharacterized protein YacL